LLQSDGNKAETCPSLTLDVPVRPTTTAETGTCSTIEPWQPPSTSCRRHARAGPRGAAGLDDQRRAAEPRRHVVAEPHGAVDLGDHGRVLGSAGLEELGNTRQTARDVAGLVDLAGDLGDGGPGLDRLVIADGELGADRYYELAELLPLAVHDGDGGVELLLPVLDDDELAPAGGLVELLADGDVVDDVDELHLPLLVGHDGLGVGVPREEQVAPLLLGREVTAGYYRSLTDVSPPTATKDLGGAVSAGLLVAEGQRRGRRYLADLRLFEAVADVLIMEVTGAPEAMRDQITAELARQSAMSGEAFGFPRRPFDQARRKP
jgi:hypothetical protein